MRLQIGALVPYLTLTALAACAHAALITVPRVDVAPRTDGHMAAGEWDGAAATCGFRDNGTGLPAQAEVVVSACYDDVALYVLFVCGGEALDGLKGKAGQRDSYVWGDSEVEVFLAPEQWAQERYCHFGINHAGTPADEMVASGAFDRAWNGRWQSATGKTDTQWFAEMAIEWDSFDIEAPRAGTVFRANFTRNAASIGGLSSWAEVKGGFHHPERFGTLRLAGGGPAAAISSLPGRQTGPYRLHARLLCKEGEAEVRATVAGGEGAGTRVYTAALAAGAVTDAQSGPDVFIPDGASSVAVEVGDTSGTPIWRQTVKLDLPALGARVARLRGMINELQRSAVGAGAEAELAGLDAALAQLEATIGASLDVEAMSALEKKIEDAGRRVNDLAMLGQVRQTAPSRRSDAPAYYVTNPVCTQKVQPATADVGPAAGEVRIAMARREYEPAQIVICPVGEDLRRVRVSAGKLKDPDGNIISSQRVVVNPIGFVHCSISTQGASLKGDVPDVLLPNRAMDVAAGRRQPFFITVQTLADDAPGEYRGNLWIGAANSTPLRLRLIVRVYDITLPVKSHLRTAFVLWNKGVDRFKESTAPDAFMEAYIRYSKVMLAHRISPITMWGLNKGEAGAWDFADFDEYLSALVPLGLTTVNVGANGRMTRNRDVETAKSIAAHLKEHGWWDLHYVYGHDEAPANAKDRLRGDYSALVEAVPGIKIMQTGWSPRPELKGLVRIWCPLTARADMAAIRAAQRDGDEAWWYVCCSPIAPYANLFVDYPGVHHRILGWMTYSRGIEGFLYWGVNVWPNGPPVDKYDEVDYANWNPNSYSTINGDGYLLYPGKGDTAIPSLRLALLRDGFEDYDLFTVVSAATAGDAGRLGNRARKLLTFEAPLIGSLSEYTEDGGDLLLRREEILRVGEDLRQK